MTSTAQTLRPRPDRPPQTNRLRLPAFRARYCGRQSHPWSVVPPHSAYRSEAAPAPHARSAAVAATKPGTLAPAKPESTTGMSRRPIREPLQLAAIACTTRPPLESMTLTRGLSLQARSADAHPSGKTSSDARCVRRGFGQTESAGRFPSPRLHKQFVRSQRYWIVQVQFSAAVCRQVHSLPTPNE